MGIRANFHPHFDPPVQHEINITPKMSFGTGHHGTTFTVMQMMEEMNFKDKTVYDFGTGTGILAILAEKLGAKEILAVDNDDWCIENANENLEANESHRIQVEKVVSAFQSRTFDIILANVNRHIIEANMEELTKVSKIDSQLVLSGLLIEDQLDMINLVTQNRWSFLNIKQKEGWISLLFDKK